ncbi:MAG: tRNA-dihydrouridine synthase family protein [Eubacterium sp.]|nr:tRNA-dihydrouridine synthase family protein [Eubacterium sp.]
MDISFAPMEGITGYIYRNAHNRCFKGVSRYFTPFIVANQTRHLKTRERRDALPENNVGINIVPQLLGHNADDVVFTAKAMKELGYNEINLNFGCPSATVVTKGRGAGMLENPDKMNAFLDEVFSGLSNEGINISVKTRLGMYEESEMDRLIEIYNAYPLSELIIHARVRDDFYNGLPRYDAFEKALKASKAPVVYNGDVYTKENFESVVKRFPDIKEVMIGRGMLINPALAQIIAGENSLYVNDFLKFHNMIYKDYCTIFMGDNNVLHKMKELWVYWENIFPGFEKEIKKIKKAKNHSEYEVGVRNLIERIPADSEVI